jgi:hypothetical protein
MSYVIDIIDKFHTATIRTSPMQHTTMWTIDYLNSFTDYTFMIYAINDLGPSPKSNPLIVQTFENGEYIVR